MIYKISYHMSIHSIYSYYIEYSKRMGPPYNLQKYALSEKITRIKVMWDHEELSFGDLKLELEDHLKVNIKFLNGNPLF